MKHYAYLIIGGGMTADSAVRGIREVDPQGSVGIISSDPDPPYDRPPLTKALWKGTDLETVWRHTENQTVDLLTGRTIVGLDVANSTVTDHEKNVYGFDKLLLATGGSPRRLPFGDKQITYFRTLADYRLLRSRVQKSRRVAVIGG